MVLAVAGGGWWYQNDQERQRIGQQAKAEAEAAARAQTEAKATARAAAEANAKAQKEEEVKAAAAAKAAEELDAKAEIEHTSAWKAAKALGTRQAYEGFLLKYANSRYSKDASKAIASLDAKDAVIQVENKVALWQKNNPATLAITNFECRRTTSPTGELRAGIEMSGTATMPVGGDLWFTSDNTMVSMWILRDSTYSCPQWTMMKYPGGENRHCIRESHQPAHSTWALSVPMKFISGWAAVANLGINARIRLHHEGIEATSGGARAARNTGAYAAETRRCPS